MSTKGKYIAAWENDYYGKKSENPAWFGPFDSEKEARECLQNATRSPVPSPIMVAVFFPLHPPAIG